MLLLVPVRYNGPHKESVGAPPTAFCWMVTQKQLKAQINGFLEWKRYGDDHPCPTRAPAETILLGATTWFGWDNNSFLFELVRSANKISRLSEYVACSLSDVIASHRLERAVTNLHVLFSSAYPDSFRICAKWHALRPESAQLPIEMLEYFVETEDE